MGSLVLPEPVRAVVGDAELVPVTVGRSSATTIRVRRADGDWVVKVQPVDPLETSLADESERLRWLATFVPVPEVVAWGSDDGTEWLVMAALDGTDGTDPAHHVDVERLVRTLGLGLRAFHDAVPVAACPFDASTLVGLDRARARVEAGRVDPTDFQPIHHGLEPAELLEMLVAAGVPSETDQVVLHGDYCVPNVLLDEGVITGYVDVGRAGVGDRHRDLAIACRSLAHNLGGHSVGSFLDAYGVERPDLARLDFFVMLDERH
jgi:aminoglycoside phosphotransferase